MAFIVLPGADASGNGNDWTANNINNTDSTATTYDIMTDVPTLTDEDTANYATMNPLVRTSGTLTFSEGNLKNTFVSAWTIGLGTIALPTSGKFYWESTIVSGGSNLMFGLYNPTQNTAAASAYTHTGGAIFYFGNGNKYINGVASAYGATFTTGDTIGVAVNLDANTITFYKNNVSQGAISFAANMIGIPLSPAFLGITSSAVVNFGQRPFAYTPPTGYLKLNTFNLPDSSIVKGNEYMDATLWTGDNTSPRSITNTESFKPDFVWIKPRSNADTHQLYDSVRGAGNNSELQSNSTAAEGGNNSEVYGYMSAFTSSGFTLTAGTDPSFPYALVNMSGRTYVGWQWKAGGTAVSNTDGTITSSVSANTTAGFSVVTYTGNGTAGATVGHGLSSAPKMMIVKNRDTAFSWLVYHQGVATDPATDYLVLNTTAAAGDNVVHWNDTAPTASVFSLGSFFTTNGNGNNLVAYCFADVEGYSKFGSYTGNGLDDGPFVYTGFRPAYLMIKRTDAVGTWRVVDTSRSTSNVTDDSLSPNESSAELVNNTSIEWDLLSNGFKCRDSYGDLNASGGTYIYMAFAENPFKNSLAR